jgi:hypothetical protein
MPLRVSLGIWNCAMETHLFQRSNVFLITIIPVVTDEYHL